MRNGLILAVLAVTVASYDLVEVFGEPRQFYIIFGDQYSKIDQDRSQIFYRTWRDRHTFHYFTTEWKPTETNIQKLRENRTEGPPNDLRPELVTWQTAEKRRYFVFTAPRFLEVDLDNYTMIKTVTAVFTEHLVDKDWNRNSYQIEKINDGAAKQVPEIPLEAENVRSEVPRATEHSFSSFELFLLFLMGMGLLFLAVCIMAFVYLWCLLAEYFYGKYIDRNHRPTCLV